LRPKSRPSKRGKEKSKLSMLKERGGRVRANPQEKRGRGIVAGKKEQKNQRVDGQKRGPHKKNRGSEAEKRTNPLVGRKKRGGCQKLRKKGKKAPRRRFRGTGPVSDGGEKIWRRDGMPKIYFPAWERWRWSQRLNLPCGRKRQDKKKTANGGKGKERKKFQ